MDKTLQWMYAAECDGGGLAAWKTADGRWERPYPEVTGYCIPTLIKYGADDLALRCADWLLSIQHKDGYFLGWDGKPRPFDTSAIVEGLRAAFHHTNKMEYILAAADAERWINTCISAQGYIVNSPGADGPEIYNLRASAIVENRRELEYWQWRGLLETQRRSHYMAYALEGALNFDALDFATPYLEAAHKGNNRLMPFYVNADWRPLYADFDYCATAQMGILFRRMGWKADKMLEAIQVDANGGIPQSTSDPKQILWGAKFYLDFKAAL